MAEALLLVCASKKWRHLAVECPSQFDPRMRATKCIAWAGSFITTGITLYSDEAVHRAAAVHMNEASGFEAGASRFLRGETRGECRRFAPLAAALVAPSLQKIGSAQKAKSRPVLGPRASAMDLVLGDKTSANGCMN